MTQIQLPEKVKYIISQLEQAGFEAYAVGGCVRDCLLGRNPNDWDVTTSAKPLEVKAVFGHTIDTGIQHGTVTVMLEREGFEVTTYRIDGEYEDSRHPREVIFTANLIEDLKRRDFTINAFAYNDKSGIVDAFHGMKDLSDGVIRCVGEASERFDEDALRILRAVRFSAQLGFMVAEETKAAIKILAPNLRHISAERIQTELIKLMVSAHPDYLRTAYETGITGQILPEFDVCMKTEQNNPHHCYSVGEHILHTLSYVEANKALRLAMLLHDIGKPSTLTVDEEGITHNHGHADAGEKMAAAILKRLKFDNDTIDKVRRLVRYHDLKIENNAKSVRRAVNYIGEDIFPLLFSVKYADIMAQSAYLREEKLSELEKLKSVYDRVIAEKDCLSLKDLAVTGSDLIAVGMKPGREIGLTLHKLLEVVLEEPEHNHKDYLLSLLPLQD